MKLFDLPAVLVFLVLFSAPAISFSQGEATSVAGSAPDETQKPGAMSVLPGKIWQLVEIVSMNDRVYAPDDPSLYTIEFMAHGTARVRADCNRGTGSWTSTAPGQLQFGKIAATLAVCPPGSLHDRFIAQFPWVRSYVVEDSHLFLATMADGSIIEFEPVEPPLAATVFGEEVRTSDAAEMREIVLSRLFDRYGEEHGIDVTDEEIATCIENMKRGMSAMGLTGEKELTEAEVTQLEQMRRKMARSMIRQWKLNRALYRQYGGRIIYQQLGPEPLDAYRQFIEERRDAGDFTIHQKAFEKVFWRYFTTDSIHDFYEPGSEEETQAFSTPPWLRAAAGAETNSRPSPADEVPASADDGGPLNWQVSRVTGGLNLRAMPSSILLVHCQAMSGIHRSS
ncbi:MAG: META domain-containing protein [Desulforhopalus sp.]